MRQSLEVGTPEAVDIDYDVAGLGTRFLAALIDTFCIGCYLWAVIYIVVLVAAAGVSIGFGDAAEELALVLATILVFLTIWGYYILMETIWSGQTIGKRALKIRVVKLSGHPIGFMESFVRNIVRFIDFLPSAYGVGVVTMFISSQSRRLGDYAAGTIVIKERRPIKLEHVRLLSELQPAGIQGGENAPVGAAMPARGTMDPDELQWDLGALQHSDLQLMRAYLEREPTLPETARQRVGGDIAGRVAAKIGSREPLHPGQFIRRVLLLRDLE